MEINYNLERYYLLKKTIVYITNRIFELENNGLKYSNQSNIDKLKTDLAISNSMLKHYKDILIKGGVNFVE